MSLPFVLIAGALLWCMSKSKSTMAGAAADAYNFPDAVKEALGRGAGARELLMLADQAVANGMNATAVALKAKAREALDQEAGGLAPADARLAHEDARLAHEAPGLGHVDAVPPPGAKVRLPKTPGGTLSEGPTSLAKVPKRKFAEFVKTMAFAEPGEVSPKGRVGMFGFSYQRLCDLGLVSKPKKVRTEGGNSWTAKWRTPEHKARFLSADVGAPIQVKVFTKSVADYMPEVAKRFGRALGKQIVPGQPITMSGLLAVAHLAGIKGLESWLREKRVRDKFSKTTAAFMAANGLF